MATTPELTAAGMTGAIVGVLLLLLSINLLYSYHRYILSNEESIQNRKPRTVLIMGYLACIYLTINPIAMLLIFGIVGDNNSQITSGALIYSLATLISVPIIYLSLYRGYIVYFNTKFNVALQDAKWRIYINPTETNWFLKNKTKWGSGRRVAIILIIIYSIFAFLGISRSWIIVGGVDALCRYILGINILISCTFGLILYCKFPRFDDIWLIRKEIRLSSLSVAIISLLYILMAPILNIPPTSPYYVCMLYMAVAITIFPILSSMLWVFIQFKLPFNCIGLHKYLKNKHTVCRLMSIQRERADTISLKMIDTLQEENGFNLFARHLTKEFAIENLLYFIETQQWIKYIYNKNERKQQLLEHLDNDDDKFIFDALFDVKFPESAPRTKLIHSSTSISHGAIMNNDGTVASSINDKSIHKAENAMDNTTEITMDDIKYNDDDPYISAVKIFGKYIKNESYFCINLASEQRKKLYVIFGYDPSSNKNAMDNELINNLKNNTNNDLKQLFHVFNDSRYECYKLMKGGFARFKSSDEFVQHFDQLQNVSPSDKNAVR